MQTTDDTPTVAVFGGGIGGLTTAQELAERDVAVTVYEANDRLGGKARSIPLSGESPLHCEHGFRFFPAYYRNVIDTLERIPDGDDTVADHLVSTSETLVATRDSTRRSSTREPESLREWVETLVPTIGGDELPNSEVRYFLGRMLVLLTSCRERRERQWEHTSWWDFIDADDFSDAYRKHLANSTQSLVALQPRTGSARTVGQIYLQLLLGQLDPSVPAERILDGPTSETWIGPWRRYLESLGVDFEFGTRVTDLEYDGGRLTGAAVVDGDRHRSVDADHYVLAVPVEVATELVGGDLRRATTDLAGLHRLETAWMNGMQFYLTEDVHLAEGHAVYVDSPWAMTSISQRQFWDPSVHDVSRRGDPAVEGVLSVIVSDWNTPGVVYDKPARACTAAEIREEVWTQLNDHLKEPLDESLVHDWVLDPELDVGETGVENGAPLFVNTVGSLDHRPSADPDVDGLYLAGDYVRTETDLATMESASEAGRRAANGVLRASGRPADVETWGLDEPKLFEQLQRQDRLRYRLGLPHPGEVTAGVQRLTRRLRG